jgi:hypothetical protein
MPCKQRIHIPDAYYHGIAFDSDTRIPQPGPDTSPESATRIGRSTG